MNTNEGQHISWSRLYKFACVRNGGGVGAPFKAHACAHLSTAILSRSVSMAAADMCGRHCVHASGCLSPSLLNCVIDLYGSHLFAECVRRQTGKKVLGLGPGHLTRTYTRHVKFTHPPADRRTHFPINMYRNYMPREFDTLRRDDESGRVRVCVRAIKT